MQKITIIGRLGRDAALRETQDGAKVVSFTVACNGRVRGVEKTSWYDVSAFNYERYKNMVKYLTKGSSVIVVGELDADVEEGRDGVTRCRRSVVADSIEFNSNGSGNTQTTETREVSEAPKKKKVVVEDEVDDEEVVVSKPKPKAAKATKPKVEEVQPEEPAAEDPAGDDEEGDDLPF